MLDSTMSSRATSCSRERPVLSSVRLGTMSSSTLDRTSSSNSRRSSSRCFKLPSRRRSSPPGSWISHESLLPGPSRPLPFPARLCFPDKEMERSVASRPCGSDDSSPLRSGGPHPQGGSRPLAFFPGGRYLVPAPFRRSSLRTG